MANIFRPHKIITNKSNTITITRDADRIQLNQITFYICAFLFLASPIVIIGLNITIGIIICAVSGAFAVMLYYSFSLREQIHINLSNGKIKYKNDGPIKYNFKDAVLADIDLILSTSEFRCVGLHSREGQNIPTLFYQTYIIWKHKANRERINNLHSVLADLKKRKLFSTTEYAERPVDYFDDAKQTLLNNSTLILNSRDEYLTWNATNHIAKILKLPLYDITHSNITSWQPDVVSMPIKQNKPLKSQFEEAMPAAHSRYIDVKYTKGSLLISWQDKIQCQLTDKHLIFNNTKIKLTDLYHLRSYYEQILSNHSIKIITDKRIYSFTTYEYGIAGFIIARIEHYFAKEISPFTIYGTYRDKGSQDISHWDKEISCKEFISTMNTGLLVPDKESLLKAITYCFYNHGITSNKYINITDDSFSDLERRLLSAGYIQKSNANQKYYWNFTNTGKSLISSRS